MNETPSSPAPELNLNLPALVESWPSLAPTARKETFNSLARPDAEELFLNLSPKDQYELYSEMPVPQHRSWLRLLAPDDAADLIQEMPHDDREGELALLDEATKREVGALLAYEEDAAGGLMNSRFVRLRPDTSVDVAIRYLRAQAKTPIETVQFAYVLNSAQKLLGAVSFRDLLLAPYDKTVAEIMESDLVTLPETMDQEQVSRFFSQHDLTAIPVVDGEGRMVGVVTVDDIVDVVEEEATEDMQKVGGMEALDAPYLQVRLREMIKKRAGWLMILFFSEMFTATAMGYYEHEISRAVVLALFIPLIISSGGNSGSQATTLVIRAMALGEVRLQDWWRVLYREICSGLALGAILGSIGLMRILLWPTRLTLYGIHYRLIAATVALSLVGIVLWGTLAGSMLPFVLRRLGFDPASASAPFVATLVDVTGIVIYFTVASHILAGTIL